MNDKKYDVDPARMELFLAQTLARVERFGVALQGVFSPADDPDPEPSFIYTIGLAAQGLPELIEFALPQQVGHSIMNDIAFRMLNGEVELRAGDTVHNMVANYPVKVLPVRDSGERLTVSNRLFGNPDGALPALQLVFPDMEGRFPWEKGCQVAWTPLLGDVPRTWRDVTLSDEIPHQLRKKATDD